MTGKVLSKFVGKYSCTRAIGSMDSLFFRGNSGTLRLDLASEKIEALSPMRPQCTGGVTVANGLLYWWPWQCGCNLSLFGVISLGSAGDFKLTYAVPGKETNESHAIMSLRTSATIPMSAFIASFKCTNVTRRSVPSTWPRRCSLRATSIAWP